MLLAIPCPFVVSGRLRWIDQRQTGLRVESSRQVDRSLRQQEFQRRPHQTLNEVTTMRRGVPFADHDMRMHLRLCVFELDIAREGEHFYPRSHRQTYRLGILPRAQWVYRRYDRAHRASDRAFRPGFRDLILARHTRGPADLERHNPNLVGGDVAGGATTVRQVIARPSWRHYRTPVPWLFLCSAATPPGGGVHGMCGYHAAQRVLSWLRSREAADRMKHHRE